MLLLCYIILSIPELSTSFSILYNYDICNHHMIDIISLLYMMSYHTLYLSPKIKKNKN